MQEALVQFFSVLPKWLATLILSAVPLSETQLSVPLAIQAWDIPVGLAIIYGALGNMLPFFPLYFGLGFLRRTLARYVPWLVRPLDRFVERAQRKVKSQYEKYGAIALFLFMAIPFPLSGIWTATLASVALKIPLRAAFTSIFLGSWATAIIMALVTLGVFR